MTDIDASQDIILLTTGGTIDKTYDESEGTLENRESAMKERLQKRLRLPYTNLHIFSLMSKDSLHMTDFDRSMISKAVEVHQARGLPIIIIHGTDTMAKTAEAISLAVKVSVPVILTGAMKPMEVAESDALQNVTEALTAAKLVGPGVYISFHNRLFSVPGVRKNKEKRTFEAYLK